MIRQSHYLDCEATALAIALAAKGINVKSDWVLAQMGADTTAPQVDASGHVVRWGDPYAKFVGNVNGLETNNTGYGVYYPPIAAAGAAAGAKTSGNEGWDPEQLYRAVEANKPVVVWVTLDFRPMTASTWTTWSGGTVRVAIPYEHAMTLVGVNRSDGTVQLADPLVGQFRTVPVATFEHSFAVLGNMAVVVG
jgi:uncharacterized protein YvpB